MGVSQKVDYSWENYAKAFFYRQNAFCQSGGILGKKGITDAKKTALGKAVLESDKMAQYDDRVKQILSYKSILARILQGCVKEFADFSPEVIETKCFHGNGEKVTKVEMADYNYYYQEVRFDILFDANLPKTGRKVIFDIEPQKNEPTSYSILSRGSYYCGRLISGQKGKYFKNSEYDKLMKVYSIWICMNSSKEEDKNSISRYYVDEECLIGKVKADTKSYDNAEIIIIRLDEKVEDGIIGFLSTLLSPEKPFEEKKNILETKYRFRLTEDMREDVDDMCNLSELVFEKGFDNGYDNGYDNGFDNGYDNGFDNGCAETYMKLYKANVSRGMKPKEALEVLGITKGQLIEYQNYIKDRKKKE